MAISFVDAGEGVPIVFLRGNPTSSIFVAEPIPKLFIAGDPGAISVGPPRDFCDSWPRQQKVACQRWWAFLSPRRQS